MLRPLALLLCLAAAALAQVAPTAALTGVLTDPSAAAIPNARVTLVNLETGFERAAVTQTDGTYQFTQVPVGLYRVEAAAEGFSHYL
ncbi:MAG TPA: carboxypeptidase-like regulatory domain-containing protein, partial [Bryobacteraceae bacterium]|nr:carboxypeptidase-like regulatory domain-containing protein [Bryobacteraceae bacterium]